MGQLVLYFIFTLSNTVGHNEEYVMKNKKLDFDNKSSLYYMLMEHAGIADETNGQRLKGCSVDQMFDDMFEQQETARAVDEPEPKYKCKLKRGLEL